MEYRCLKRLNIINSIFFILYILEIYYMNMKKFLDFINEDKVYRGIGKMINKTYGGVSDNGMGVFWTDSKIMAKWFAGLIEYNPDTEKYETISTDGEIKEKDLYFENPYIIDENNKDYDIDDYYDSFHIYMGEIKKIGGVKNYKTMLLNNGYDGIILKGCVTNYYKNGTYNIYIEL